jgi:hypothetical protein
MDAVHVIELPAFIIDGIVVMIDRTSWSEGARPGFDLSFPLLRKRKS